ncbi:hypothetical protein HPP92_012781 [Vanilla planifolia]|uniref:Toprim domain-containing protein n=1 Tax=Vanilla planifolia TaxID=51239 RepID=A0A835R287_VANPL|nr:hypothetical protein HPP92_012781 [Vanilla planifolia]
MSLLCCPFLSRTIRSICLMQVAHQLMEVISGDVFAIGFSCRLLHSRALPALLCVNPVRSNLRFISRSLKSSGSGFRSYSPLSSPNAVRVETREGQSVRAERTKNLQVKLAELGIGCDLSKIGQYMHALCPKCDGGESKENSLSIFIREDGKLAMWSCFRTDKCGWKGRIEIILQWKSSEDSLFSGFREWRGVTVYQNGGSSFVFKSQSHRTITETDFDLEPLCPEVIKYFSFRGISIETLRRNAVLQRRFGNEIVIAFTYRRNGKLVSCKYRTTDKKFWQEKDTEKIFYGLDDIVLGSDIIIVEGEIDKLSLEEAGYRNCLSVPNGAVSKVSNKVPCEEEARTRVFNIYGHARII